MSLLQLRRLGVLVVMLLFSFAAHGAIHLWKVNEVYSNADGTIQYVELTTNSDFQNIFTGTSLTSSSGGNMQSVTFNQNTSVSTANKKYLIATPGFASLGIVTPDFIIPAGFLYLTNGSVSFGPYDTASYSALPTNGTDSLNRLSLLSFGAGVVAINSPTNFAGNTATITPPATAPGAPINVAATSGDSQASISFSPPANNGGATISGYTATCTPGPVSQSNASSPIVLGSLMNGTQYSCTVTALNSAGSSAPSASVTVTPVGPPSVPLNVVMTPGNNIVTASFSPPASNGGSMINQYTFTCSSLSGSTAKNGSASPLVVTGLTNGVAHTCNMRARNAAGFFSPFTADIIVTPDTVPGAPTLSTLVRGDGRIQVNFAPPANNGGTPILSFGVKCNNGGGDVVVNVAQSPALVTGLTNLSTYACRVSATNAMGTGPDSTSGSIIPDANVAPRLLSAVYRKLHSVAGAQDIPINLDTGIEGNPTVESRNAGSGHRVVMNFNVPIFNIGLLMLSDPMNVELCCASASYSGFDTTLTLTGLPAVQRMTVLVDALNGAGSGTSFSIAFMPGDVTSSRGVNAADISAVKARGGPVTSANARFDINLDGTISSSDTSIVKSKSGTVMP